MEFVDWSSLIVAIVGSGSILYLLLDKLVLSKREKVDVVSAQSDALQDTIEGIREHNKYLESQIAQKDGLLAKKDNHYIELMEQYHKINDKCGSLQTELMSANGQLQFYKDRHCCVVGCAMREPPSVVMSGDPKRSEK